MGFKKERNDSSADTPTKSSTNVLKNGINDPSKPGLNKKDRAAILAKHMKQYDSIKLEAARLERDAQRINLENAVIEGERLRKESAILDVELDTIRIDLAIKREEAGKMGIIIQDVTEEESAEKEGNIVVQSKDTVQTKSSVEDIANNEEIILRSPSKRIRKQ